MNIGFIGTGIITEAVVTGLCTIEQQPNAVCLSPRNAERARILATQFEQVTVANNNQAVIDNSDIVCLAVRPQVARDIIEPLNFRPEQIIVSFIATFSGSDIANIVGTPITICRVVPLPAIAKHQGPVVLSPPIAAIADLLRPLGTLIQVDDDKQLNTLLSATSLMAPFFQFLDQTSKWLSKNGIEDQSACRYIGSIMHALSITATEKGENGYTALIHEHATAQGLNEQALRELKKLGWYEQLSKVLDLIHARTMGMAGFEDTIK